MVSPELEMLRQLLQEGRAGTLADCLAGVVDVLQQEGDALHDDLTLLAVRGRRD